MIMYERFTASPAGALTLVDAFANWRRTMGTFPAVMRPVRFALVERRQGGAMVALDPIITISPVIGPSGTFVFADETKISGKSQRITPGEYVVRIESDHYQTVRFPSFWPIPPQVIDLKPGPAYPFPDLTLSSARLAVLRGTLLRTASGAPIAGADIRLLNVANAGPFSTTTTSDSGGWALALDPVAAGANRTLRFTLPSGGGVIDVAGVDIAVGENSLRQTALQGRVVSKTNEPIADATITVSVQPGMVRSARDGRWTFFLSLLQISEPAVVTATAPNGRSANVNANVQRGETVSTAVIQIQ